MAFFGLENALLAFRGFGALYGDRAIANLHQIREAMSFSEVIQEPLRREERTA